MSILNNKSYGIWDELMYINVKRNELNLNNEYVSGTTIKNYLLNDPLIDWLDLYFNKKRKRIKNNNTINYNTCNNACNNTYSTNLLFEKGNKFENEIINELKNKFDINNEHNNRHNNEHVTNKKRKYNEISDSVEKYIIINDNGVRGVNKKNYNKTIVSMKKGIPLIFQAVLFNDYNKTCGVADILIRSDYINKLVNKQVLTENEMYYKAPNLNGNYHYRVIDIKWTTMTLCSNGINIRNEERFPAYKGQLAIYNCAIGKIQGYIANQTYIMSKSWKIGSKINQARGYNCFDLLGVIDYDTFDLKYIDKTKNAVKWIHELRNDGIAWNIYNPEREEMYPNASNKFDTKWISVKKNICKQIAELTQIWYVSEKNRKISHSKNIMRWDDERCNSKTMEINSKSRSYVIDCILNINRNNDGKLIQPDIIHNNDSNWNQETRSDLFVDFETITSVLYNDNINIYNSKNNGDIIFMIGVSYKKNNEWKHKSFVMKEITEEEEFKICDEFTKFVSTFNKPKLFHWSNAEIKFFNNTNEKFNNCWNINKWTWIDMYNVFISEPIVLKNVFTFKLKDIATEMYKNGMIKNIWNTTNTTNATNNISNGFDAMCNAIKYYKNKTKNKSVMNNLIEYNKIDCLTIANIVEYLRNNHTV